MRLAIVTGDCGLIGSETCHRLDRKGLAVVGLDNHLRARFFGPEASTPPTRQKLECTVRRYQPLHLDIRDADAINQLFAQYGKPIKVVVHTAAQPSHDWAARAPMTDFGATA